MFNENIFSLKSLDDYLIGKNRNEYVLKLTSKQLDELNSELVGWVVITDMYDGFKIEII